jgi:hypothetical protein
MIARKPVEQRDEDRRAEADRVEAVRSRGVVPPECGPEIAEAPARGAFRVFEDVMLCPEGADGWKPVAAGWRGRKTMRHADAFDVMQAKARRAMFTPGQVAVGRYYAALHEAHVCAGVRCASLETSIDRSPSGGGEYIDAVLRDRERLDVLRARIGSGCAMAVRKVRPSARGSRVAIPDRRLVDAVCIEEKTLADVLAEAGWTKTGKSVSILREALCEALERMMGPQPRHRVRTVHY